MSLFWKLRSRNDRYVCSNLGRKRKKLHSKVQIHVPEKYLYCRLNCFYLVKFRWKLILSFPLCRCTCVINLNAVIFAVLDNIQHSKQVLHLRACWCFSTLTLQQSSCISFQIKDTSWNQKPVISHLECDLFSPSNPNNIWRSDDNKR